MLQFVRKVKALALVMFTMLFAFAFFQTPASANTVVCDIRLPDTCEAYITANDVLYVNYFAGEEVVAKVTNMTEDTFVEYIVEGFDTEQPVDGERFLSPGETDSLYSPVYFLDDGEGLVKVTNTSGSEATLYVHIEPLLY